MTRKILYIQGVTIMGGAPNTLIQLAGGLDRDRFEPYAVVGKTGILKDALEKKGVKTYVVKMGMWRKGKSFPFIPASLYKIYKIIKREGINLVHNNTLWDNPYGLFPAKWNKIPVICHIQSPMQKAMIKKYFLSRADRLVCVSEAVKIPLLPELADKVSTIYNGIDTGVFNTDIDGRSLRDELGVRPDEVLVGLIGRLDPLKGQETTVKAFSYLKSKPVKLMIVGESSPKLPKYRCHLEQMSRKLQINEQIIFTGYRNDIPAITAALDIAILPSLHEGFGLTIIEAMACKKPVIATNVGGIPEIISDGETGFIIPPENPRKLAESLEELIDNPELRTGMGAAGYKRVTEHFSAAHNTRAIQQVYDELLK